MQRAVPEALEATPFATMNDAQNAHLQLVEQAGVLEEKYGNASRYDDPAAPSELDRLSDTIREFELRLSATGARLPAGNQRSFAQSLLDFWAVRQADLRALSAKFQSRAPASSLAESAATVGCLLVAYDEATARETADRAEAAYQSLPDDVAREAARAALTGLAKRGDQPLDSAEPALAGFVEAGALTKSHDEPTPAYALAHAALPEAWPRLAEWIAKAEQEEADLERLKSSAEAWSKSGSAAELPRGEIIERAARYSTQDDSLSDYVAAARRRNQIERVVRATIFAVILGLLGLAVWNYFNRPTTAQIAEAKDAVVTQEIADREELVNVSTAEAPDDDASPSGLTGWIWIGSPNDPKVVGVGDKQVPVDAIRQGMQVRTLPNLKVRQDKPDASGSNIAGARQAGVSAGTLAVALEDSAPVDVKGSAQYWLKVRLLPVVYVQYDKKSQAPLAGLREALERGGFNVPPEEGLANIARPDAPASFDVRFYYKQDEAAARRVAQIVARALQTGPPPAPTGLVDSPLAERVKTGTIEVWLYRP